MENNDFMNKRLTKDAGEAFSPARYGLKSGNDAIIAPYRTYELFFEITFMVIQKLGAYEDIGTPEECLEAIGCLCQNHQRRVINMRLIDIEKLRGCAIIRPCDELEVKVMDGAWFCVAFETNRNINNYSWFRLSVNVERC